MTRNDLKGLSGLTLRCFGAPLNKKQCMTNWEKRPLTKEQLEYAALDAFILLKIHDLIQTKCSSLGFNYRT